MYGLELDDVFSDPELSIGSYRRSVSTIIPEMTRVALRTKHAELVKEHPDFDQKKFVYRLSRAEYEKEWDNQYQKPGWRTRFFAAFVRILPKIGPLKNVDITLPTPTSEDLYIKSVNKTLDSYKAQLTTLRQHRNHIDLPNSRLRHRQADRAQRVQACRSNLRQTGGEIGQSKVRLRDSRIADQSHGVLQQSNAYAAERHVIRRMAQG